jgi:putative hydrolase
LQDKPDPNDLERLIRQLIESGQIDPKAMEQISGLVNNPGMLTSMFSNLQSMFSQSAGSVNWELALGQGVTLAKSAETKASESLSNEIPKAIAIALLWLNEVTDFGSTQPPKLLTRSMWVQDAMPLFKELSEPIATSMSKALSENLGKALPEQFAESLGTAANFLGNAGATIFAMQLGQAAGRLASDAVLGSEIGIPLSDRPGFVTQNLAAVMEGLETPKTELLIYLATRELVMTGLFSANPYLRERIVSQVREFAAGLTIDTESIQELAEQVDLSSPDQVNHVIEMSSALAARTPEQELALSRIEFTLALVEGWVDSVTNEATKRLPSAAAMSELFRRRRSSAGISQKAFATLLGLELTPKLVRECEALWTKVASELGHEVRDRLISHPDQLPSVEEIQDPQLLIARLSNPGDDWDSQLRDLLGN